ncbi:glycosyltransferase family 39 protein [Spirosoma sp. RP8]|uniref:Glycosyltransferase family 39 protein n=1 Tax=Spirosoma liriopis TaxID=2937440 RepID=A0ABT0HLE8_9BACT|nr:glycosyltransferase family 39 protein [Spirosoma liriopis]MCK8492682.1 glycosyltransferase family 39 protein [Spirosoma liriopis]
MTDNPQPLNDRWFYALVAAGVFLNATGLFPPILEPDGALYACIAKTMAQTGDFVDLYAVGHDWLDKPHFPFWVSALSYLAFGINTFAYKFPALLFFLGSVLYSYKFVRLSYAKLTAQVAVLVLLTAFHGVLSNSDVRAEPYLILLIIGPVYHFYRVFLGTSRSWLHLVVGSFLTGCALMTKGLFVLVPIGGGLVIHWLLTGNWREFLKPRWYLAVVLSFVFTLPEIYCLYQQFDLHPEKVVFGNTDVSGIRFFFWDSQFGRFFNTGPIKGAGDKFFFVHTLLWAFLPWSLPLYLGVGKTITALVKRQNPWPTQSLQTGSIQTGSTGTSSEYVSLGSGLATFLLFSLSGFQLPHYLNIVFPFYAIITAQFLVDLSPVNLRRWTNAQTVIGVLLAVLIVAVLVVVQPAHLGLALSWTMLIGFSTFAFFRKNTMLSLMGRMVGAMLLLAGILNLFLYPTFMQYQAGLAAARFVNEQPQLKKRPTVLYGSETFGESSWSYEFYVQTPTQYIHENSIAVLEQMSRRQPVQVFTTNTYADSLEAHGFQVRRVAIFPYFHISQLTYDFLNYNTRSTTLKPYVLADVRR